MQDAENQEYVRIIVLDSHVEAQLVASILDEREIPHVVRSYHDTAYDGLFQVQKGWGEISAPSSFKSEIKEVVLAVRENPGEWESEPTES